MPANIPVVISKVESTSAQLLLPENSPYSPAQLLYAQGSISSLGSSYCSSLPKNEGPDAPPLVYATMLAPLTQLPAPGKTIFQVVSFALGRIRQLHHLHKLKNLLLGNADHIPQLVKVIMGIERPTDAAAEAWYSIDETTELLRLRVNNDPGPNDPQRQALLAPRKNLWIVQGPPGSHTPCQTHTHTHIKTRLAIHL